MNSIGFPILISSLYLVVYTALACMPFDLSIRLAVFMFSLSPLPVIWLVWKVLRDKYNYPGQFEKQFYRDREEARA